MNRLPRQNRAARRRAGRRRAERKIKTHAFLGDAIEIRSLANVIAIGGETRKRSIVGDAEKKVRPSVNGAAGDVNAENESIKECAHELGYTESWIPAPG